MQADDGGLALRELEAALAAHPQVGGAAVAVLGEAGDEQLVACVVGAPGGTPDGPDLRRHLAAALPGAELPDVFVLLDRLPLTPTGEVDRETLGGVTRGDPGSGPAIVGGVAAEVADIWREVLQVDAVSLCDDLFDLGGHSLAITRMVGRIRSRMGVKIPLESFYDTPTVPGIASAVEEIRRSSPEGGRTDGAAAPPEAEPD